MMRRAPRCEAEVSDDWHRRMCVHAAKMERQGRGVCATHAKMYDKWAADPNRHAAGMAKFWWGWQSDDSTEESAQ